MNKKLALAAMAALALAAPACTAPQSHQQPDPNATGGGVDETVDECPRADGQPCR